jgi:hypothetical protein
MANISNTTFINEADWMGKTALAEADAYVGGTDAFDIMVREENPDDLTAGVAAAIAVNTILANATGLAAQFAKLQTWLSQRAVAAGSDGIDSFLADRFQRLSYSYDRFIFLPLTSQHLSVGNIMYDQPLALGTLTHGGAMVAGVALPVVGSYAYMVVQVLTAGGIGAADWHLHVAVTYADGSTGTEAVDVTTLAALGTKFDIGALPVTGLSKAGQALVLMSSTAGMVAGQVVLVTDAKAPALLTANALTTDTFVTIDPMQCGPFSTGDNVTVTDGSNSSSMEIVGIDYRTGVITFDATLAHAYAVTTPSYIVKTVAGRLHQESHTIASVQASTSITLTGNLQHTYGTYGTVHRLIKAVTGISTDSGGSTGDEVEVVTQSERAI